MLDTERGVAVQDAWLATSHLYNHKRVRTIKTTPLNRTAISTAAGYLALVALFLFGSVAPSFASIGVCTLDPEAPKWQHCPGVGGDDASAAKSQLARTFHPQRYGSATGTQVDFEMTRDDFLRLYAIGREVHISYSPKDEIYEMNIGFTDLVTAQTWQLPAIPTEDPSIWMITDPAETPHVSLFPEATHALISTNDQIAEGTVYLYYNFGETALILLGEAVEPPNGAPLETVAYDIPLALFPMNEAMEIYHEEPFEFEGAEFLFTQDVAMHGFGTFQVSDDETLEAAAFYDDIIYRDPDETDPNTVLDFEIYYSIFGEDGTWFSFYIADPPEGDSTAIVGDIYLGYAEYWRVVDPTATAIEAETPPEAATWSVYPNPATDVIRFSEPMTVSLYDVLGRSVRSATAVQQLDVSDLSPGLYLVRADTGQSKTLIIQ